MFGEKVYLTKQGYERLIEELKRLKSVKRKKIAKDIDMARKFGDLSENAEYDAAKEAQAVNEKRINYLEQNLSKAQIIENLDIPKGEVRIGATVEILNIDTKEKTEYKIVSGVEAGLSDNTISITSPIAKGLLGHKEGDEVKIELPQKTVKYIINNIYR